MAENLRKAVEKVLSDQDGILNLKPAFVAREFPPGGHRLGLKNYSVKDKRRGEICERWFGSTTTTSNKFGPKDESLSHINTGDGSKLTLNTAIDAAGEEILGRDYYRKYRGTGIYTKYFDYKSPIPFHLHQMEKDMRPLGLKPKAEAYYFPEGVPLGPFPYTFFGVHPSIARRENREKLIPYLREWDTDGILKLSRAYKLVQGEGFFLPAGVLHAPGTALTLEIQEASDVYAVFQGRIWDKSLPQRLLWKETPPQVRKKKDFKAALNLINWEISGDPYFYEHYHTVPKEVKGSRQKSGVEYWIFYGTDKFSGKKAVIKPGGSYRTRERGAYTMLVYQGEGRFDGHPLKAGWSSGRDEYFVTYRKAASPTVIRNTGRKDLVIFKFFGPGINPKVNIGE